MMGFLMRKNIFTFLAGCLFGGVTYTLLWSGWSETYKLSPLTEVQAQCYAFKSDDDIRNIARHAVVNTHDRIALIAQKRMVISSNSENGVYYISGRPMGVARKLFAYFLSWEYTPTVTVILEKDSNNSCLHITESLYQKD